MQKFKINEGLEATFFSRSTCIPVSKEPIHSVEYLGHIASIGNDKKHLATGLPGFWKQMLAAKQHLQFHVFGLRPI